jgi:hypothetical protein
MEVSSGVVVLLSLFHIRNFVGNFLICIAERVDKHAHQSIELVFVNMPVAAHSITAARRRKAANTIDLMHNDVTRLDAREECWS